MASRRVARGALLVLSALILLFTFLTAFPYVMGDVRAAPQVNVNVWRQDGFVYVGTWSNFCLPLLPCPPSEG